MAASWGLLTAVVSALMFGANAAKGDWKLEYPPWGEPNTPTSGSPQIWVPLLGPFTGHGCFPSRYLSMRAAFSHLNRRDASFCPAIATLKNKFEMTYDIADSNSNGIETARSALKFLNNRSRKVNVVLGPNGSGSSMSLSNLLAVFGIAHISWASTSAKLSDKIAYPMFFRVVAPDSLTMRVLAGWLDHLKFKEINMVVFDAPYQLGQLNHE